MNKETPSLKILIFILFSFTFVLLISCEQVTAQEDHQHEISVSHAGDAQEDTLKDELILESTKEVFRDLKLFREAPLFLGMQTSLVQLRTQSQKLNFNGT